MSLSDKKKISGLLNDNTLNPKLSPDMKGSVKSNFSIQSKTSASVQQYNELRQRFLNFPLRIANRDIAASWLSDIDKATYNTYILNAFYLLEIQHFFELVLNQESDNLFRINQIHGEQIKLTDGQLLKTFQPPMSKDERSDYVYTGQKFQVEIQKRSKILKRFLLRDGFVQSDGIQINKTQNKGKIVLLFKKIISMKVELNLEMHKALLKQKQMEQELELEKKKEGQIAEFDMPSLGNMHTQVPTVCYTSNIIYLLKEKNNFILNEESLAAHYFESYKQDLTIPWQTKNSIYRLNVQIYKIDKQAKTENIDKYCVYFTSLRYALRTRDFFIIDKIDLKNYVKTFQRISSIIKSGFTTTFYDNCFHNYKLNLLSKDMKSGISDSQQFSLSSYLDSSSNQQDKESNLTSIPQQLTKIDKTRSLQFQDRRDKMQEINLFANNLGQSDAILNTEGSQQEQKQQSIRESLIGLQSMIRPIETAKPNEKPTEIHSPRKETSHFNQIDTISEDDLQKKSKLDQEDTIKSATRGEGKTRFSLTTPNYIYNPENDGIIQEQADETKQSIERQLLTQSKPFAITGNKPKVQANVDKSKDINKYVSNASSQLSQEPQRITEKSEPFGSEDSFIDFFNQNSKSDYRPGPPSSLSNFSRGQRSSINSQTKSKQSKQSKSSSDGSKQTLPLKNNPPPQKTSSSSSQQTNQNLAVDKQEKNSMTRSVHKSSDKSSSPPKPPMDEDKANQVISKRLNKLIAQRRQNKSIENTSSNDSPTFKEIAEEENIPQPSTNNQINKKQKKQQFTYDKQILEQGNTKLASEIIISQPQSFQVNASNNKNSTNNSTKDQIFKNGSDLHIQQLASNQQSNMISSRPMVPTKQWVNQSHVYEQKTQKGAIQYFAPNQEFIEQSNAFGQNKVGQQPQFFEQKIDQQEVYKKLLLEHEHKEKQSQVQRDIKLLKESKQQQEQQEFQHKEIQKQKEKSKKVQEDEKFLVPSQKDQDNQKAKPIPQLPDHPLDMTPSRRIADVFANIKPIPAIYHQQAVKVEKVESKPQPQQSTKYDVSFNQMEIEIINEEHSSTAQQINSLKDSKKRQLSKQPSKVLSSSSNDLKASFFQSDTSLTPPIKLGASEVISEQTNKQSVQNYQADPPQKLQYIYSYEEVQPLEGPIFEENYKDYVDLDNLPRITRNHLLASKVKSLLHKPIIYQDEYVMVSDQQPPPPESPQEQIQLHDKFIHFSQNSKSGMLDSPQINIQQQQTMVKQPYFQKKPIQKQDQPLRVLLKLSNNNELKLLWQNEWWKFNLHIKQQQDTVTRSRTPTKKTFNNRDISPNAPTSLVRDIYKEYKMVPKSKNQTYPQADWQIIYKNGVFDIVPLGPLLKVKPKIVNLHLDVDVKYHIDHSASSYKDLLYYLGMLINNQYVESLETYIVKQLKVKQGKNNTSTILSHQGLETSGFNLKYVQIALQSLVEILWASDNQTIFMMEQYYRGDIVLAYTTQMPTRQIDKKGFQIQKTMQSFDENDFDKITVIERIPEQEESQRYSQLNFLHINTTK